MTITRNIVDKTNFNPDPLLPYELRLMDFESDNTSEPAADREPMTFTEVYLANVGVDDFRRNPRGELGTRTATLDRFGVRKLREHWLYLE